MESQLLQERLIDPLISLKKTDLTNIARYLNGLQRLTRIPISLNKAGLAQHIASAVNVALQSQDSAGIALIQSVVNMLNQCANHRQHWIYADGTIYNWKLLNNEQRARLGQQVQTTATSIASITSAPRAAQASIASRGALKPSYRNSPFYDIVEQLTNPQVCSATYARASRTFVFSLNENLRALLKDTSTSDGRPIYEIRMFCSAFDASTGSNGAPIEFPHVCELKVNQTVISGQHLRGLKNKPGTVHPYNITSMCGMYHKNFVELVYANTAKSFIATVQLVKRKEISSLVEMIKSSKFISKEQVLAERKRHNQDADIVVESETVSTKCPLSFTRINTPCRAQSCRHAQCFDATTFLAMNEQTPTWSCPVCNRQAPFEDLVVDGYYADLLANATSEFITIDPDGKLIAARGENNDDDNGDKTQQKSVKEESIEKNPSEFNAQQAEILILDDDDDDNNANSNEQTEQPPSSTTITQPQKTDQVAGTKRKLETNGNETSAPKRPQVIDLTLDSEDEEEETMRLPPEPTPTLAAAPQEPLRPVQDTPLLLRLPSPATIISNANMTAPANTQGASHSNVAVHLPSITTIVVPPPPPESYTVESNGEAVTSAAQAANPPGSISASTSDVQGNNELSTTNAEEAGNPPESVSASTDDVQENNERATTSSVQPVNAPESTLTSTDDAQGKNEQVTANTTEAVNPPESTSTSTDDNQQNTDSSAQLNLTTSSVTQDTTEADKVDSPASTSTTVSEPFSQPNTTPSSIAHTVNTDTQQTDTATTTSSTPAAAGENSSSEKPNASFQ